jgi:hypothetical protein
MTNIQLFLQEKNNNSNCLENNIIEEWEQIMLYTEDNNDVSELSELYNKMYTTKQLLRICDYYSIPLNSKSKRKNELIQTIIWFEQNNENLEIVQQRIDMWSIMDNLYNDEKIKKYLIWG